MYGRNLLYLAKTWHHFGISDQNLTSPAKYPKYLRTKFKNIQPLLRKIKNKIRLKFSIVKNTQMFLEKKCSQSANCVTTCAANAGKDFLNVSKYSNFDNYELEKCSLLSI